MYMKVISQIDFYGVDVLFRKEKDFVGYTFKYNGEDFGHKLLLSSKKHDELVGKVALLALNAFESVRAKKYGNN